MQYRATTQQWVFNRVIRPVQPVFTATVRVCLVWMFTCVCVHVAGWGRSAEGGGSGWSTTCQQIAVETAGRGGPVQWNVDLGGMTAKTGRYFVTWCPRQQSLKERFVFMRFLGKGQSGFLDEKQGRSTMSIAGAECLLRAGVCVCVYAFVCTASSPDGNLSHQEAT